MRSNAKRIAALTLAVLMSLSALPGLAGEYSSGPLNVKDRVKQPTPAPVEETETPAPETEQEKPAAQPTAEPTVEPTEEPYVFAPWSGWIDASEASNYVATVCDSPNGSLVGQIRRGEYVNVVEESGDWLRIEGAVSGWVMSRYLSDSEPAPIEKPQPTEEPVVEPTEPEATEEPVVEPTEPEATEEPVVKPTEPEATEEPVIEPTEPEATEEPVVEPTEPEATEEPVVEETEAPVVEETEAPEATDGLEETVEPEVTPEPTVEPTATPETTPTPVPMVAVKPDADILFERDAEGNLVFDENGDPIAYVRGELGAPLNFERDAEGNLILDENGDPAVYIMVEAKPEVEATEEPEATEVPVVEEETVPEATEEPVKLVANNAVVEVVVNDKGEEMKVVTFDPIENVNVGEGAPIRLAPNGLSEIIADITADDAVTVLGIYGDWVKVNVAGIEGYVYIDDVEGMKNVEGLPEEEVPETDDPAKNFKVTVFSNRRRVMELGETITLTSKIEGFEGLETLLQWQCDKGNGFEDVAGANSDTHSFSASVETLAYDWRLIVYYR